MDEFISSMLWPLAACVVLVGIHVYLGMHVLLRQVIFVDLALAQIAALGSVFGIVLGYGVQEFVWANKAISLGFASCGALFFAFSNHRTEKITQETIIGISYAVALSLTLLLSTQLAHGADELRELFSGNILWVEPAQIIEAGLLYAALGAFHFKYRKQFFAISRDHGLAKSNKGFVRMWNFFFYFSFAMVVTSSVSIAGVLLVFAFLVIPAATAFLLCESLGHRLLMGWSIGAAVSIAGVVASYYSDLPTGPVIVVMLAAGLAITAVYTNFVRS